MPDLPTPDQPPGAAQLLSAEAIAAWADQLQALARTGLFYTTNDYDRERYERILAIAAEMAGALTDQTPREIQASWCKDVGHVTPKVGVGAAIFDDTGRLLLTQRPESGLWALPVGFAEVGETAASGAEREVREETGLVVRAIRLLAVAVYRYGLNGNYILNLFYRAEVVGGELSPNDEATDVGWFAPADVPTEIAVLHDRARSEASAGLTFGMHAIVIDWSGRFVSRTSTTLGARASRGNGASWSDGAQA